MKNLRKINRSELKNISGGITTWEHSVECEKGQDSIALCPQESAVKCIQLEPGNAIGCSMGQNCINGACTGGLVFVK